MPKAVWAILPLLSPHSGDLRRNAAPYVLTEGFSASCLNIANFAKRTLEARGVACFVDLINT